MFLGKFSRCRDIKLRVPLPPEISAKLGEDVVIAKGHDRCLLLFPLGEFRKSIDPLLKSPLDNSDVLNRLREITGAAFQVRADKQRRITLPLSLARYASLSYGGQQRVIIVGMGLFLELWNAKSLRGIER